MSFNNEMKYFSALAVDNSTYNFSITPTGEIFCIEFGTTYPASKIELKPNFVLRKEDGSTLYSLDDHLRNRNKKKPNGQSLIIQWNIPTDVFEYLIDNKKLMYSYNMALLYGFDTQYAFDQNHNKKAFKSTRHNPEEMEKRLLLQKSGQFN